MGETTCSVLILVLMEHTLGEFKQRRKCNVACLNPCSNGTYSRSPKIKSLKIFPLCLNPCSNGTYSRRTDPKGLEACFAS